MEPNLLGEKKKRKEKKQSARGGYTSWSMELPSASKRILTEA